MAILGQNGFAVLRNKRRVHRSAGCIGGLPRDRGDLRGLLAHFGLRSADACLTSAQTGSGGLPFCWTLLNIISVEGMRVPREAYI